MTMLTEPYAPWLRDLNRLFTGEGAVTSFIPSADVLVSADGVSRGMHGRRSAPPLPLIGAGPRPLSVSLAFPCPCSRACWSS